MVVKKSVGYKPFHEHNSLIHNGNIVAVAMETNIYTVGGKYVKNRII